MLIVSTYVSHIGWHYYLPFILLTAINVVIIWFYFPNTNQLALEEIAAIFGVSVQSPALYPFQNSHQCPIIPLAVPVLEFKENTATDVNTQDLPMVTAYQRDIRIDPVTHELRTLDTSTKTHSSTFEYQDNQKAVSVDQNSPEV